MKKIKKLIVTFVLLALCVCCVVPFVGCDTLNADDWKEVQSIICYTDDNSTVIAKSICFWDISKEEITQEEYSNAPSELHERPNYSQIIPLNKTEFIGDIDNKVGKTYYSYRQTYNDTIYEKHTYNSYELQIVRIKISDKTIEIEYNGNIEKYTYTSYEITYFEN